MLTAIALLLCSLTSTPDALARRAPRPPERAARLLSASEQVELDAFTVRLEDLKKPSVTVMALRVSGIVGLAAGAAPLLVAAVIVLSLAIVTGPIALFAGSSWGSTLGTALSLTFSFVPGAVWLALVIGTVIGAGLLVGSFIADIERQRAIQAVKAERRDVLRRIDSRPALPPPSPVPAPPPDVFVPVVFAF